jgi:hypothetical protein
VWINAELVLWIYSEVVYVDLDLHSVCGSTPRKYVCVDLGLCTSVDFLRRSVCASRLR